MLDSSPIVCYAVENNFNQGGEMVKVLVGFITVSVFMLFVGTLVKTERIPLSLETMQVASYCVSVLIGLAGFVILSKFRKTLGQITGALAILLAFYIAFSAI